MEQNNFNGQGTSATETRDPLPTFGDQPQNGFGQQSIVTNGDREPLPTLDFSAQPPVFAQTVEPQKESNSEVEECAGSAFGKSLAAAIMAWFPICSIIAIILGSGGLKRVKRANELAAHYGVSAGGKNVAAKILGMVGKIAGIVMTVIYSLYFVIIIGMIGTLM